MAIFGSIDRAFEDRAKEVPRLGLGLSVDVYSPDILELNGRFLSQEHRPEYLEIFRANERALQAVRQQIIDLPLTYHGEGLWVTQPDFPVTQFLGEELNDIASQLAILRSPWLNHECATKQMAGYSFGTYLPPLYTPLSARVVADNIAFVQEKMDLLRQPENRYGPLFLLEMPPLTYFMAGTMPIQEFFRLVTELVPCGLVLDIGHLWTVYRYTGAREQSSLEQFLERFLEDFPLERVIEVHIAGLSGHEAAVQHSRGIHPEWIDAHAAPIQAVCWTMLEQVLAHPRLVNLRGVALEVDTKAIDRIIEEFQEASRRFKPLMARGLLPPPVSWERTQGSPSHDLVTEGERQTLQADYASYARIASGQQPPSGPEWQGVSDNPEGLNRYIQTYLPHEIFQWGGAISEMFPDTCRAMDEQGMALGDFLPWWFRAARPIDRPYDYFLLKIERFLGFIAERAPALVPLAEQEGQVLRSAYMDANEPLHPVMEPAQ